MAKNSKRSFLLDTSAFISLESVNLLKEAIRISNIITANSVIKELNEFSKYDDENGKIAKRVLKLKNNFSIKSAKIKEKIKYLENTDNELFNLSKQNNVPLISDDHKLIHHTKGKIETYFSTFFIIALVVADIITKENALKILEELRDIRNWESNIIYIATKEILDEL